jgi:uncharacterized protein YdeI (YjbR/CyaY-like superfamily)
MSRTNPKVEAFFANAKNWQEELIALREILKTCPVTEEFKWRSPCYTFRGANIATIWGFKESCALSFFKGVLLKDTENILVSPGENSRSVRMVKFGSYGEIARLAAILKVYVQEAVENEKAGLKVELKNDELEFPEELVEKLREDPPIKAAFDTLTPGRQRGYAIFFSQPKLSSTRVSRIEKCIPKILAGKGLHDR